jgi:hypothetical protein
VSLAAEREWLDGELARVVDWRKVLTPAATPFALAPPSPIIYSGPPGSNGSANYTYANGSAQELYVNSTGRTGLHVGPTFTDADVRRLEHPEEFS